MVYSREEMMYPLVRAWLERFLRERYSDQTIRVFDASRKSLARLIDEKGLIANLPAEWPSWDIHVDVVGFTSRSGATELAFVECKNVPITLGHFSQLLGYSRVAQPRYSFLLSPQGISDSLKSLLITFHRTDILQYSQQRGRLPRSIIIAKWGESANAPDYGTMVASDASFLGQL